MIDSPYNQVSNLSSTANRLCFLNDFVASDAVSQTKRLAMYRLQGLRAGAVQHIASHCFFTHPDLSTMTLGDRTYINFFCFFDNVAAIVLETDVFLAPFVKIFTSTHENGWSERRVGDTCIRKPVTIGRGSWVCANATVLPGVTIGQGCIIAAGAVVTRDCEPDGLYGGVPAKRLKDLTPATLRIALEEQIQIEPGGINSI